MRLSFAAVGVVVASLLLATANLNGQPAPEASLGSYPVPEVVGMSGKTIGVYTVSVAIGKVTAAGDGVYTVGRTTLAVPATAEMLRIRLDEIVVSRKDYEIIIRSRK